MGAPTAFSSRSTTSVLLAASRIAAVASATTTPSRTSDNPPRRRLTAATAAAMRSRGMVPDAPTLRPRLSSARRCMTGTSRWHGWTSHTRRWNELLPRSQTAARCGIAANISCIQGGLRHPGRERPPFSGRPQPRFAGGGPPFPVDFGRCRAPEWAAAVVRGTHRHF